MKRFLLGGLLLSLALGLLPLSIASAQAVTVTVDAPATVPQGGEFVARLNITAVAGLEAYQVDISYNAAVIRVKGAQGGAEGVTPGQIASTTVPVDMWAFIPSGVQGTIRVLGNMPGVSGVSGSGFLAEVHFEVVGALGSNSNITPSGGKLFNNQGIQIPSVTWVGDSVQVATGLSITTASLPEGKVGDAYSVTLAATGGIPPLTWGATGLPGGLTVSTGGVLSGTPTQAGDFSVTITVRDSAVPPNTTNRVLPLKVWGALVITTASLPDGKVGDAYSSTLVATGGKPPLTWGATGLPAGLAISTGGTISGTPTVSGDFTVNVTVTDSFSPVNTATRALALRVYAALAITTASLPEGKVGDAYSVTLAATGGRPPLTWGATGLPAGLTISTGGLISGTPTASGDFTVNITVSDSFSPVNTATRALALKVYPALEITTVSLPEGKVGHAYSVTLTATGGKPPLTWGAGGLPTGLGISTGGVLSGNPTQAGDFTVVLIVIDSFTPANTVTRALPLKIYAALEITTASLPEGKVGDAYSFTLAANGGRPPLTWGATGLPAGLTLSTGGTISGTPTATGDFTVNVTVSDSFSPVNTANRSLALKVYPALEITTTAIPPEGKVGHAYSVTLAATGGKPPLTWGATGLPAGLTISTGGVISGTPTAFGDFTVNATVSDSFSPPNSVSRAFALKVYGALEIATTALAEGKVGGAYTFTLTANGGKPPLTWGATGLPAGLSISTGGVISGTPTAFGDFTVTVTVSDSFSPVNTANQALTLKIYQPCDANGDGSINMADVIKLERIILGLDPPTPGADCNGDGAINMGDVTAIERRILEIS